MALERLECVPSGPLLQVDVRSFALGGAVALIGLLGLKLLSGGKKGGKSSGDDDGMYVMSTPAKQQQTPAPKTPARAAGPSTPAPPTPAAAKQPTPQAAAKPSAPSGTPVQSTRDPIQRAASEIQHGAQREELAGIISRLEGSVDKLGAPANATRRLLRPRHGGRTKRADDVTVGGVCRDELLIWGRGAVDTGLLQSCLPRFDPSVMNPPQGQSSAPLQRRRRRGRASSRRRRCARGGCLSSPALIHCAAAAVTHGTPRLVRARGPPVLFVTHAAALKPQEERALSDVTARLERVMNSLEAKRPRRH